MPDSTVRPLGNLAEEKYSAEDYASRTAFTYHSFAWPAHGSSWALVLVR